MERGFSPNNLPSAVSTFYTTLKRADLAGTKVLHLEGDVFELRGYYPSLINDEDYHRLQASNLLRVKRKGKGDIPGLITGMKILHCGYCGAAVVGQNTMGRRRKADGTIHDGHRRLICSGNSLGIGCDVGGSVSVVPVEKALLAFCSDQLNLTSLQNDSDHIATSRAALKKKKKKVEDLDKMLERVMAAMLVDEEATPITFVRKARELESQIVDAKRDESLAEADLSRASQRNTPAIAKQWQQLAASTLALDYEARMRVRQMVADTFERIVIYHRGTTPESSETPQIDVVLITKGGRPRMLGINRKSGAWVAMESVLAALDGT